MNIELPELKRIKIINSDEIFSIMQRVLQREELIDQSKEHFWFVGLASDHQLLFIELITIGGRASASVSPREAFQIAVQKNAASVIMVHNHPDGNLRPSEADEEITDHFIQVGRFLDSPVIDHLIITDQSFFSFEINGIMERLRGSLKYRLPYEMLEQGMERGFRKGRRDGELNKARQIARAALEKGIETETIAEISGLPEEEIRRLTLQ
ncbi:MAG: DNA repair protein RadC [Candidatus Kentron sp. G]|nr:MAG: DNA repair protein RadC [Candidatus Kentron sp. G]VFN02437.1 MAG: DNA repair protein RadC [Candidatus Kentron sp. G]VFN04014.1 MAG: DNA repair protein RadC [Candidatus Kentron sp. G]